MAKKQNLLEILGSYGFELSKRGLDWWMSCPFHEDRNPSFSVSYVRGEYLWYCFSCKRGGSELQFVQEYEHVGRSEAINKLSRFGHPGLKVDSERDMFTELIFSLPLTLTLRKRGVNEEAITAYKIGYCKDWNAHLEEHGIDPGRAFTWVGHEDLTGYNVFPSWDANGVFAIQIRKPEEKIMRSPKGKWHYRSLYGIEQIKQDHVFIFEGQIDTLVAASHGIKAVAMGGTRMYDDYWKQLEQRNIRRVTFVPDADAAGYKFLEDMIGNYPKGFEVDYIPLSHGDPDDAILEGKFDPDARVYPVVWYVNEQNADLEAYRNIGRIYHRLPEAEQGYFRKWIIDEKGDDIVPHLVVDAEPDMMAEQIVLANMIASPRIRNESMKIVTVEHFHSKHHEELFKFIEHEGDNTNPVLVKQVFGENLRNYVDLINYKKYVTTVNEIWLREKIAKEYREYKADGDLGRFIERIYMLGSSEIEVIDTSAAVSEVMEELQVKYKNPGTVGIPFGANFTSVNDSLLGYVPSKLIIVSGNAGHGKTTLICNWISDLVTMEIPILFISMEMSSKEIMEKLISIRTGVPGPVIMSGSVTAKVKKDLEKEGQDLREAPFWMVHGAYKLGSLIGIMRSQIIKNRVKVIFLDYLQLIQLRSKQQRWEQLMEITSALKTKVCNPLGVTMVAISQLSKGALQQANPDSTFLAGSYGMLADADVAIAVRKTESGPNGNFIINIDKHRYNRDDIVIHANFNKQHQIIKEL